MLLLAADFYYLKNIAGRRLVGLRWWNEVDTGSGDSHWVFESQDRSAEGGVGQNATDRRYVWTGGGGGEGWWANMRGSNRFFWLALYAQPGLWVALALIAVLKLEFKWLSLVGTSSPPSF